MQSVEEGSSLLGVLTLRVVISATEDALPV